MSSMRHYIHLAELFQVDSGGHPPVLTDLGDGDGPQDGEYWVHGNIKVKPDGVEANRDDSAHTMVLYSKKPFSIAPENLQVKTGGFWHPLVSDYTG